MIANAVYSPATAFTLSICELTYASQQHINSAWQSIAYTELSLFSASQIHDVVIPQLLAKYVALSDVIAIRRALNQRVATPVYVVQIDTTHLTRHSIENELILRLKSFTLTDFVHSIPIEQIKIQNKSIEDIYKLRADTRMRYTIAWSMVHSLYVAETEVLLRRL